MSIPFGCVPIGKSALAASTVEFVVPGLCRLPDFEPLLNSHQAAQLLDIHHKTLQKLARRGEIHGSHVGKMWRFRASDLNAWLDRQQRAS